jgi:hypothetical protein
MQTTHLLFGLFVILLTVAILIVIRKPTEPFENGFTDEKEYKQQIAMLSEAFWAKADAKRPVSDLLSHIDMKPEQQNFVNFYSVACRFPGYVGPMNDGYIDMETGVQTAVKSGCRVFVIDIDYLDDCNGEEATQYFPRLVVRDVKGRLIIKASGNQPLCNTDGYSNLKALFEKINFYAFADSCQQASDPIVIVLYFQRQPPGSYKSKAVLDYYSHVAKALAPFQDRFLTNELDGGTFYRQKQESRLLINNIKNYNGRVLIFSNANTNGFREVKTYSTDEDLDYMTQLRLSYTQTKLGVTDNDAGSSFGILQTAEDFTVIPSDRSDEVMEHTKLRWTICLPKDPSKSISKEVYDQITKTYGVHCVSAMLFDPASHFLFDDPYFKTYGFLPKPEGLRYIKPPVITPAKPNPSTDAKQGLLRAPIG